jgi:predicted AlkP superfamily phosphohydrolase/phosphomutase
MVPPGSWPSSLLTHLNQTYLHDKFEGSTEVEQREEKEFIEFHQQIIERVEAKSRASVDLIQGESWDLFSVSFMEAHDLGHQSWHWHDPSCDNHPKEAVARYGDPMLQTLQSMDQAIGDIMKAANAEHVFLVAGLGMQKQCALNSVVQPILGQFCGMPGGRKELTDIRFRMPYFEVPHNMNSAMIRINLKGRESQGIIEEQDYEEICQTLIQRLWSISDAETGECVVERIIELQKTYPGDRSENLPDICVEWKKPLNTTKVKVDDGSEFKLEHDFMPEMRQGDHDDSALFISSNHYQSEEKIPLGSIASTISRTMGVNFPCADEPALKLV